MKMRHIARLMSRRMARPSPSRPVLRAAAVAVVAGALTGCGVYDLPELKDKAVSDWTEVENAYQQRAAAADELIAIIDADGGTDQAVVTRLDDARSAADAALVKPDDLDSAEQVQSYQAAQTELASAIEEALVAASDQAVFRGNEEAASAIQDLEGSGGTIRIATDAYNASADRYNKARGEFPNKIWADRLYTDDQPLVTLETTAAEIAIPEIDFSAPSEVTAPGDADSPEGTDAGTGSAEGTDAAGSSGSQTN